MSATCFLSPGHQVIITLRTEKLGLRKKHWPPTGPFRSRAVTQPAGSEGPTYRCRNVGAGQWPQQGPILPAQRSVLSPGKRRLGLARGCGVGAPASPHNTQRWEGLGPYLSKEPRLQGQGRQTSPSAVPGAGTGHTGSAGPCSRDTRNPPGLGGWQPGPPAHSCVPPSPPISTRCFLYFIRTGDVIPVLKLNV